MQAIQQKQIGILLAIAGVILFSSKAVLVKLAYAYGIDSVTLLLFRMLFSMPVYLVLLFFVKAKETDVVQKSDYLWVVFFGFIGYYLASYFDFQGLQYIKAGLERIVLFIYPTLVLVLSRLVFKTKISRIQLIAMLCTYVGVIVAFSEELNLNTTDLLLGVGLVFLSALTYAMYLVGSGWLIPKFGVMRFTCYAMLVSTICVFLHYWFSREIDVLHYPKEIYFLSASMALFSTVIPSFLVSQAIKMIGSSNFAIIGSIGPISTIVLANIYLDESFSSLQILGTIIVISGVFLLSKKD